MRTIAVRKATEDDGEAALRLMAALDLIHTAISIRRLWVVAEGETIVGVAHLERMGEALFLSSVGVAESHRHMGFGRKLIEAIIADAGADIYIYTVIPEFFSKLGFAETVEPEGIPARSVFGCDLCKPGACKCMVRRKG